MTQNPAGSFYDANPLRFFMTQIRPGFLWRESVAGFYD
jgi:hypothetical protein